MEEQQIDKTTEQPKEEVVVEKTIVQQPIEKTKGFKAMRISFWILVIAAILLLGIWLANIVRINCL